MKLNRYVISKESINLAVTEHGPGLQVATLNLYK